MRSAASGKLSGLQEGGRKEGACVGMTRRERGRERGRGRGRGREGERERERGREKKERIPT